MATSTGFLDLAVQAISCASVAATADLAGATAHVSGLATVSDVALSGAGGGSLMHSQHATVARTDTVAKTLFVLPANAVIVDLRVSVPVASDAVTTAIVSVGKSGAQTAYLAAQDVKGAGTGVIPTGAATSLGSIGSSVVTVTGIYAETGGASSTGGPFSIYLDYTTQ